jgi:protein transport protein SEC61 subunit alpha
MPGRFLNFFRPVSLIMPEVKPPSRRVSFNERLVWTGLVLVVYLIMAEIPLYGAVPIGANDPFYYLRVIFASNRGSLMELGIQPIVTAGMVIQLLGGSGLIDMDQSNPEDRSLMSGVTKFFSIIMTTFIAIAYLLSGAYGTDLSIETSLLIFLQLFFAGIVLMLLDELLQKGWGFGSGISLFIAAGVAQKILWNTLSPLPFPAEEELGKSTGALIAYIQSLLNGENPLTAFLYRARLD